MVASSRWQPASCMGKGDGDPPPSIAGRRHGQRIYPVLRTECGQVVVDEANRRARHGHGTARIGQGARGQGRSRAPGRRRRQGRGRGQRHEPRRHGARLHGGLRLGRADGAAAVRTRQGVRHVGLVSRADPARRRHRCPRGGRARRRREERHAPARVPRSGKARPGEVLHRRGDLVRARRSHGRLDGGARQGRLEAATRQGGRPRRPRRAQLHGDPHGGGARRRRGRQAAGRRAPRREERANPHAALAHQRGRSHGATHARRGKGRSRAEGRRGASQGRRDRARREAGSRRRGRGEARGGRGERADPRRELGGHQLRSRRDHRGLDPVRERDVVHPGRGSGGDRTGRARARAVEDEVVFQEGEARRHLGRCGRRRERSVRVSRQGQAGSETGEGEAVQEDRLRRDHPGGAPARRGHSLVLRR